MKKFEDGDVISAIVLVKSVKKSKTKNGADYLKLIINDGHDDISAFVWDLSIYNFQEGEMVKIKGEYETYNDKPKINVRSAAKTTETIKLPSLDQDTINDLLKRFNNLIALIGDEHFKAIIDNIFVNGPRDEFIIAPAAKSNHQAYLGGLLEHTVEVAEMCHEVYKIQSNGVNLSLLIAGAILHDIGKTKEYVYDVKFDRSTIGKLIGHTSLGLLIVSNFIPDGTPAKKTAELFHLILSHHGKRDWGAPVEPLMKEAIMLHNCDMINCYGARFNELKSKTDVEWSEFDNTFNRSWYLKSLNNE